MQWNRAVLAIATLIPSGVLAQDSYKIEAVKQTPPDALAPTVRSVLNSQGFRILDGQGKSLADVWLRRAIPAAGKPSGPKGTIQFPELAEGELLGALRFADEGHDYRDQSIPKGVYTLRYGLQPVNGDHLGVSPYRDYALLLPSAKDNALANLPQKKLEEQSAESAGTSHPAVLMLLSAPSSASKGAPTMIHDEAKNTWAAVLPLSLEVKGESAAISLPVQLMVVGTASP